MRKPQIAILLDENTSGGGARYEASKGYFRCVHDAGGLPFAIPFIEDVAAVVRVEFDALVSTGGRFAYPREWYVGAPSAAPASERFDVERGLVRAFLDSGKPILRLCAGMQMIACLNGCRLTSDLRRTIPGAIEHDRPGYFHTVRLRSETRLRSIVDQPTLSVNSYHREAIVELSPDVVASAHAEVGAIEAIELSSHPFALGLQSHQELFAGIEHAGNRLFRGLIEAC